MAHSSLHRTLILILSVCAAPVTAQTREEGFVQIFNGKTLEGWDGDSNYWRVEDGCLVGEITADKLLKNNSFIIWRGGSPKDFELKLSYRITKKGNSGINYRSEQISEVPFALKGYQADIDGSNKYTGQNYEERARTTLAYRGQMTRVLPMDDPNLSTKDYVKNNAWTRLELLQTLGDKDSLKIGIKDEDWNEVHLIVKGNRMKHFVNGVLMSDVTDDDPVNRKMSGLIGVQVHVGPPMKVEYRDIRLR